MCISMAKRGDLGIHAEVPTAQCLRSAGVVNGALRSKAKQKRGGLAANLSFKVYPRWSECHGRAQR